MKLSHNLDHLSSEQAGYALAQLAYDLDALPDLAKASSWKMRPMDPHHPELNELLRRAQQDWARWGKALVDEVAKKAGDGWTLGDPIAAAKLAEVFRQHQVRVLFRWSGPADLVPMVSEAAGLTPPVIGTSYIEAAWRLGRSWEPWTGPISAPKLAKPAGSFDELVQQAITLSLTDRDRRALDYAKTRAAIYMRRPLLLQQQAVHRGLLAPELAAMQRAVGESVRLNLPRQARLNAIRKELQGHRTLTNELDRVERTEMAYAHCDGAMRALEAKASQAGVRDPLVFKLVRHDACPDCKRIWGYGKPKKYKLSVVKANEAAGGNFGKNRKHWVAVPGPIHPNCTEGPLQFGHPAIMRALMATVPEYFDTANEGPG